MQSLTRSMSIPGAAAGTPSRSICRLKSSAASFGISGLDAADEAARVQDPVGIEGLLEGAHDREARRWAAPDVESRLHRGGRRGHRSEEHTSELQSRPHLVCRLLLEKKKRRQCL